MPQYNTYTSDPVYLSNGQMSSIPPRYPGHVVNPGYDQMSMDLLKQLFGPGVGPMEGKRRLQMQQSESSRGRLGDYMGGRRKAMPGEGNPPRNYNSAVDKLNDMLYMTGGYINPQRNMGDLWRYYHGF